MHEFYPVIWLNELACIYGTSWHVAVDRFDLVQFCQHEVLIRIVMLAGYIFPCCDFQTVLKYLILDGGV